MMQLRLDLISGNRGSDPIIIAINDRTGVGQHVDRCIQTGFIGEAGLFQDGQGCVVDGGDAFGRQRLVDTATETLRVHFYSPVEVFVA